MKKAVNLATTFVGLAFFAASFLGSVANALQSELLMQVASINADQMMEFVAYQLLMDPQPLLASSSSPPLSFQKRDYHLNDRNQLPSNILLSPQEEELFMLLKKFQQQSFPSTTIRVAGGWVRDKLLQQPQQLSPASKDIDFVISDYSAKDFAKLFQEFYYSQTNTTTTSLQLEQSKKKCHDLETATMQLGEFTIDIGHLRLDTYYGDSRIPDTKLASPVQDAWRRDLTINSLFYNLRTNQIEDWTEKGIRDIVKKRVATPKSPLASLQEDPLRIFRAIRFATIYSMVMDDSLIQAAKDPLVLTSIQNKLSKSRMAEEIESIFQSANPSYGIKLLLDTGLLPPLLQLENSESVLLLKGWHVLTKTQSFVSKIFTEKNDWNQSSRRLLWYAAFSQPYYDYRKQQEKDEKPKTRQDSILFSLLNNRLKLSRSDVKSIESVIKGSQLLQSSKVLLSDFDSDDTASLRWQYYEVLKDIGPLWKESVLLAFIQLNDAEKTTGVVDRYCQFQRRMEALGFDGSSILSKFIPKLNGVQIQACLPNLPQGASFRKVMSEQEKWQVMHEKTNDTEEETKEALIAYLKQTFPEYL